MMEMPTDEKRKNMLTLDTTNNFRCGDRVQDVLGFTGTVTDVFEDAIEVTWDVSGCAADLKARDVEPMQPGQDAAETQCALHAEIFRNDDEAA
jgi:preprotein translocase subunit YajC